MKNACLDFLHGRTICHHRSAMLEDNKSPNRISRKCSAFSNYVLIFGIFWAILNNVNERLFKFFYINASSNFLFFFFLSLKGHLHNLPSLVFLVNSLSINIKYAVNSFKFTCYEFSWILFDTFFFSFFVVVILGQLTDVERNKRLWCTLTLLNWGLQVFVNL